MVGGKDQMLTCGAAGIVDVVSVTTDAYSSHKDSKCQ